MAYTVMNGKLIKTSKTHGPMVRGVRRNDNLSGLPEVPPPNKADKGEFAGSCNRTACQRPGATWFNHSTRRYYCRNCAWDLNRCNRRDAQELYGHDLCTDGPN